MISKTKFIRIIFFLKIMNSFLENSLAKEINPAINQNQENSNEAERVNMNLNDAVVVGKKIQESVAVGGLLMPNGGGKQAVSENVGGNLVSGDSNSGRLELLPTQRSADPYAYALSMPSLRYPTGIVEYYIETDDYDDVIIDQITQSMDLIESMSCVKFERIPSGGERTKPVIFNIVNPNNTKECVHKSYDDSIYMDMGYWIVIGYDCIRPEEILHTLMHGLGFRDEVNHPHRDQYIRVIWENIQPKYRPLYGIRYSDPSFPLLEYDPASIMHFHDRAFSANGGPTFVALTPGLTISHRRTLSNLDVMKLQVMFGHACKKRQVDGLIETCKNALPLDTSSGNDDLETTTKDSVIVERRAKNRLGPKKWRKNRE